MSSESLCHVQLASRAHLATLLQVGVQRRLASHLSACRSAGVDFIPIAEALGGLAEDTIMIVRSCVAH